MRAGQPFAMRYPLVEVGGSCGNLMESGNWAAPRYTSSRLSAIMGNMFEDIEKNTIKEWRDNYDDTKQYPSVLPTKGFYNIVNGTSGIGIGMASSVPAFNLTEVNAALVKLLWCPDVDFEEIYCAPDFATGAVLLNESEVKESLKNGTGKSCRLRSVVEYDEKERCLIVKEIPYGVYTNTICGQLEALIEENCGIDRFNDLTGKTPLIKIYLTKTANPEKVLKLLYKETSLQYYYGINMTMLDGGKYPRVFTWKEALEAFLDHQIEVYRRGFEYDLKKIEDRLHIVDGILIALASIEEVIQTIKNSSSAQTARLALQQNFILTDVQAKAILDIKLARLAHLEAKKYEEEREQLLKDKERIETILGDEVLLKKEIEKDLIAVSNKYGDKRRTQVLDLQTSEDDDSPIEEKNLIVHLTNKGNLYTFESSTLMIQKRGGRGIKVKMQEDEVIIDSITDMNTACCLAFSNKGKVYSFMLSELPINEKVNLGAFFDFEVTEKIVTIVPFNKVNNQNYMIFVTKNGLIKKTSLEEYRIRKSKGVIAIKLKDNDELCSVMLNDNAPVGILTKVGKFLIIDTEKISPIGRATSGVIGIKLAIDDYVVDSRVIPQETREIISVSANGLIKRNSYTNFSIGNRATKGSTIQKLKKDDSMQSFIPVQDARSVVLVTNCGVIRIPINEIQLSSDNAQGTMAKKMKPKEFVTDILGEK